MNNPERGGQPDELKEPDRPLIYVASLSDYVDGRLHGVWLDAARDDDEVAADVAGMLAASPRPEAAEEYAIHDHEGFGAWQPGEYEALDAVTAVARAIVEHGEAISHWIDYAGEPGPAIDSFTEAYLGCWASLHSYAEHLVEEMGLKITVTPESWQHYVKFDYAALAGDLAIELYSSETDDGSLYVFQPNALDA